VKASDYTENILEFIQRTHDLVGDFGGEAYDEMYEKIYSQISSSSEASRHIQHIKNPLNNNSYYLFRTRQWGYYFVINTHTKENFKRNFIICNHKRYVKRLRSMHTSCQNIEVVDINAYF